MCLEKARLISPKKNVTCYKLCMYDHERKFFISPYMCYRYDLGIKEIVFEDPDILEWGGGSIVEGNAFHTFKTLVGAKSFAKNKRKAVGRRFVILKCLIPKDSKFIFEGEYRAADNTPYKCYASQQLLPVSVVKDYSKC